MIFPTFTFIVENLWGRIGSDIPTMVMIHCLSEGAMCHVMVRLNDKVDMQEIKVYVGKQRA